MGHLFAFDPGTHAIGWAVFAVGDDGVTRLAACGVHLLPPRGENRRDGELARRDRAVRKWRRRRKARLAALRRLLSGSGLLPTPGEERDRLFSADPWALRQRGQCEPLTPGELGRAILHLAARRGADDPAASTTDVLPIELLWPLHDAPVRQRRAIRNRLGLADPPPSFGRSDTKREFGRLWARQSRWCALLGRPGLRDAVENLAFGEPQTRAPGPPPRRREDAALRRSLAALSALLAALEDRFGRPQTIAYETALPLDRRALAATGPRTLARRGRARRRSVDSIAGGAWRTRALEIDHIIDLAAGGRVEPANEQLIPAGANRGKGASGRRRADTPGFARRRRRDMAMIGARLAALLRPAGDSELRPVSPDSTAAMARDRGYRPLPGKNRDDHRHNAADAVAIGLAASPALFAPGLAEILAMAALSVTPVRKPAGRMHCETLYGAGPLRLAKPTIAARKPVRALTKGEIAGVRDGKARARLGACLLDAPEHSAGLAAFRLETGARRLRLLKPAADAIALPANRSGAPDRMVRPRQNYAIDIVAQRDGSWRAFGISLHDRMSADWRPRWEAARLGGKLAMRLCRGDCIELDAEDGRMVFRVHRLAASNGYVWLAGLHEAGDLGRRHGDPTDPFRFLFLSAASLKKRNAVAVDMTPDGRIVARRSNVARGGPGSGEPDPEAPETGRPTATDSVCHQAH